MPRHPFDRGEIIHYSSAGVEIAMGLPAFKEAFEDFKTSLPSEAVATLPVTAATTFDDIEQALSRFDVQMTSWWATMVPAIESYRKLVETAAVNHGEKALRFGIDVGVPYLVARIDQVIGMLEDAEVPKQLNEGHVRVDLRARVKRFRKRYNEIFRRHIDRAYRLRDSASMIAWDFDPEARGGKKFGNVDDLIASLKR